MGVTTQPGLHRLQPVALRGLGELALPHRASDLRGDPVLRLQQRRQPIEQLRAEHGLEVVGRERVQG
jgi:hypothetical protein